MTGRMCPPDWLKRDVIQIVIPFLLQNDGSSKMARKSLQSLRRFRSVNRMTRQLTVNSQIGVMLMKCLECLATIPHPERIIRYLMGMRTLWGPAIFVDVSVSALLLKYLNAIQTPTGVIRRLTDFHAIWGPVVFANTNRINALAVSKGVEIIAALERMGYDLNKQDNRDGQTPLINAVYQYQCNVIMYLVDRGVDLNIRDNYGHTAMDIAQSRMNGSTGRHHFLSRITLQLLDRNDAGVRERVTDYHAAGYRWGY